MPGVRDAWVVSQWDWVKFSNATDSPNLRVRSVMNMNEIITLKAPLPGHWTVSFCPISSCPAGFLGGWLFGRLALPCRLFDGLPFGRSAIWPAGMFRPFGLSAGRGLGR